MTEPTEAVIVSPQSNAIIRASDNAMAVSDILAQVRLIQEVMGKVMQEGEHYGKIPGCGDKKTLLQPGAQKLTMTFRLAPEYAIQETNFDRGHKEYRVICTLKSITTGNYVGQGVGCCSTLEGKYRYRMAQRTCPDCGAATVIKGKKDFGGGWLCWQKKGGCGAKWTDEHDQAREWDQAPAKEEHDNPADFYNTVLKMAKKRAFVDATITATAASDIFTQDVGDAEGDDTPDEPSKSPQDAPGRGGATSSRPAAKNASTPPTGNAGGPAPEFLEKCRQALLKAASGEFYWAWWRYAVDKKWILPSQESLADAQADLIFTGCIKADQFKARFEAIQGEVMQQAKDCPPELRDEILLAAVPLATKDTADTKASAPVKNSGPPSPGACPKCKGTATKQSEEYEAVRWCQKCGWQWDSAGKPFESHSWMFVMCPKPPKGMTRPEYEKNPMTMGQLCRVENKRWYASVMGDTVAETRKGRDWNGKHYDPSAADLKWAEACEQAKAHLEAQKAQKEGAEPEDPGPEDDVPF